MPDMEDIETRKLRIIKNLHEIKGDAERLILHTEEALRAIDSVKTIEDENRFIETYGDFDNGLKHIAVF